MHSWSLVLITAAQKCAIRLWETWSGVLNKKKRHSQIFLRRTLGVIIQQIKKTKSSNYFLALFRQVWLRRRMMFISFTTIIISLHIKLFFSGLLMGDKNSVYAVKPKMCFPLPWLLCVPKQKTCFQIPFHTIGVLEWAILQSKAALSVRALVYTCLYLFVPCHP